ncbi:MAG: TolC family protein [Acidobacteria bacterium]|jgi:cobalt-zinc-cadmium efflux system outer membrane protein|nr:TolC family protein [Acidobacteriota bacterium]
MWFERLQLRVRLAHGSLPFGLVVSLLVATQPAAAGEERRLTLEEALELAEQAPQARAAALEVEGVEAESRGEGLWPNPELVFEREAAGDEMERVLALTVPLPLSGHLGLERSAARAALAAAQASARQAWIERRTLVRESFLEVLAAQQRDAMLATALGRLDDLTRTVRARAAAGESSGYDLMKVEGEHADLVAQRLEARAALAGARAVLASRLGLPTAPPLVAEGTLEPGPAPPESLLLPSALAGRGDVEALAAEAERRELLGRAAGRRAYPQPAIVVGRKTQCVLGFCESGPAVGVSVTLPLFDRQQGERASLQVEAALLRARRDVLLQEAQARLGSALAETRALREAEAALAEAPSGERLFVVARAAYEAGEMPVFELLDAHRSALAQSLRRVDSRLAARKAELRLCRAMGVEPTH